MMTIMLRVILIVVSLTTVMYMLRKIRQAKMQIEAAMFWVFFAAMLVMFSLFPPIADFCARLLGIYSTPNFLFLSMIFLLIVKAFSNTLQLSQLESKQKELVQKMALDAKEKEDLKKRIEQLLTRLEETDQNEVNHGQ